jgi:4-hydroxy-tetrahydrodipicolinate synthase
MIQGNVVALVTPMHANGAVDYGALRKLVEWHIDQGTDAIVSVGTTGESATLDEKEHCEVIARTLEFVAGRIPVIAGTGANATTEAIRLTRCAADAGADACLLVTPYYNKSTQEGLYLHHRAIAEAVDIPQILYNVPGRTACDMLPETAIRLSAVENIVGIKEATGELRRIAAIRAGAGEDFVIYSGDDATGCEAMLQGANGVISVTTNVMPAAMKRLCDAALAGEQEQARQIDATLEPLHRSLFLESNPIPVKWALKEMGMIEEGIRLPLTWLSESCHEPLRAAMRQAGAL